MRVKRRVLKVGNASLAVSLPSKWAKQHQLRPGDEIDVLERDGGVFVSGKGELSQDEVTLHIRSAAGFARRLIYPHYIRGRDTIIISYDDPAVIPLVERAAQIMLGFDVVAMSDKRIVLKNIAKGLEQDFETYFTRLLHAVRTMAEMVRDALAQDGPQLLQEAIALETLSNKINLFCKRAINTQSAMHLPEATALYSLVGSVEQCGDSYRDLCLHLQAQKKRPAGLRKLLDRMIVLHDLFFALCTKPTVKLLAQFREEVKSVKKELLGASETQAGMFLYAVADCVDNSSMEIRVPVDGET